MELVWPLSCDQPETVAQGCCPRFGSMAVKAAPRIHFLCSAADHAPKVLDQMEPLPPKQAGLSALRTLSVTAIPGNKDKTKWTRTFSTATLKISLFLKPDKISTPSDLNKSPFFLFVFGANESKLLKRSEKNKLAFSLCLRYSTTNHSVHQGTHD